MAKEQSEKLTGTSLDISAENRTRIKQLFPAVFIETRNDNGELVESIDFEKLKAELGTYSDLFESRRERYGMDWPGKKEALRLIQTPSYATLKPCREESVNFDTTENLYIEGDNLEVLKLLQKSYYGKVKMIEIDPPYNTGKEFIYPDNYTESLETYLEYAGMIDGEGKKFSTNTANEGRFHTKWLNMMYPRLYLARNLLRDDGVIFIHIDDNEASNLRKICDEIFGEENFKADISWQKRYTRSNNTIDYTTVVEHLLVYAKSESFVVNLLPRTNEADGRYSNPDNDSRGAWKGASFLNPATPQQRPNLCYPITNSITGEVTYPTKNAWRRSQKEYQRLQAENLLYWGPDGRQAVPSIKMFLSETRGLTPINFWSHEYAGNTDDGTRELESLISGKVFNNPKPSLLIRRAMEHACDQESIVLDFFSGSATTAHAVLDLNKQDNGNRKFILVQLPEPCAEDSEAFKAGYKTIADIGKERIRRVIKKLTPSDSPLTGGGKETSDQFGLFDANPEAINARGFMNYNVDLKERSRDMRKNPTASEEKLWKEFLCDRPEGFKFTRQKPLQNFIVDFYCSEKLLAIEADGGIHQEQKEYDEQRDTYLQSCGIRILRFSNGDILNDFDSVKTKITEALKSFPENSGLKSPCQGGFRGLGFKVLKLDKSNFKQWQKLDPSTPPEQIVEQLSLHIDHISHKATPEDLLYEILLKAGFTPTEKIETKTIAGKKVFSVADGALLLCLEDTVTRELIDAVAEVEPMQFICLDSAFHGNDQLKANAVQTFAARNMQKEKHNQIVFKTV